MAAIDFNKDGQWDAQELEGPAIHAPADIRDIVVTTYRVEWLNISDPQTNFYAKNHMVSAVVFATPQFIGDKDYMSARLSEEILRCGEDYAPGTYTLALQKHEAVTLRAAHYRTYTLRAGTTIGALIDAITSRGMHHFIFLLYTDEDRFKGCGHHLLRVWAVYVKEGIITSANSVEDANTPLSDELTYTYLGGGKKTFARVGRGRFLITPDEEDEHVPDEIWSRARPHHQTTLANPDAANADAS
ncbi:hypothetical protein M407DRAFT_232698 [Tulasnella calospora MUT 4182]|uniref:DUF7770 domain-containing protein n=1 Tax=Tulasnella calospora MUT 4182 TaxID=1051891 RepID=A0A0C3L166_9AGAM|nr:hypothetical protein M407DRAFT_232698 [Tulasnella calospora MUT 4182]